MSLSRRENQILAEIEQALRRQDRAFASRMDALNAARPEGGRWERFGYNASRREFVCVVAATFILTAVLVVLTLALPDRSCTLRTSASAGPSTSAVPAMTEVRRPACRP
ncbi:DUF3040 domain-containing protein [Planomonospora corallina]|uniref:DUF3040 domain-containing protein n=1 Tax=Planomonospora corallina TaxID=1806052 RepID=A0ABV8I673_9ACTN